MSKPTMTRSDYEWAKKHMHGGRDFPATIIPDEDVEQIHRRIREGANPRFVLPADVMRNGQTANDKLRELLDVKTSKRQRPAVTRVVKKVSVKEPARTKVRAKAPTVVQRRPPPPVRSSHRNDSLPQVLLVIGLLIVVVVVLSHLQGGPGGGDHLLPTPSLPGGYLIATLI